MRKNTAKTQDLVNTILTFINVNTILTFFGAGRGSAGVKNQKTKEKKSEKI